MAVEPLYVHKALFFSTRMFTILPPFPSLSSFAYTPDAVVQSLGQVGRVVRVFPSGDVRLAVNGNTWTFNPLCMKLAPGETPPDVPGTSVHYLPFTSP